MSSNTTQTEASAAQRKNEQKISREHATTLVDGLDDEYVHIVKIGSAPRDGREDTRTVHKFGLLESNEMVYTEDSYNDYDAHQFVSPMSEEEVAEDIEDLVKTVAGAYKTTPGCEPPVEVEYEPAERMESADLDNIEGIDLVKEGESS